MIGTRRRRGRVAIAAAAALGLVGTAVGGPLPPTAVSVADDGSAANGPSFEASVSNNGRYVVFRSHASNLDPAAATADDRIYLRDRLDQETVLLSAIDGTEFGGCYNPHISANGRIALFQTYAAVLEGEAGGHSDFIRVDLRTGAMDQVFLYDTRRGTLRHVSRGTDAGPAAGDCLGATVANNGVVAFRSAAANLIHDADPSPDGDVDLAGGDGNGATTDVFLVDTRH